MNGHRWPTELVVSFIYSLRQSGDAAMISGYLGKSEELNDAMVSFAFAYADQTENDHRALITAGKSGRIKYAQDIEGI